MSGIVRKSDCHPDRKHYAKGLCNKCYNRTWVNTRLAECHPERKHFSKGFCVNCYHRSKYSAEAEKKRKEEQKAANPSKWRDQQRKKGMRHYYKYHEKKKAQLRVNNRLRNTGWADERFKKSWEDQKGLCDICTRSMRMDPYLENSVAADHDHETKELRSLICRSCNLTLGFYEKRLRGHVSMQSFEDYLKKFEK